MARGMERAVELRSLLCSSLPEPSRAAAVPLGLPQATFLWPQGTAIATRGGLRGPRQAGRGGMGSAAWPPAPPGLPTPVAEGALELAGPVPFGPGQE